MQAAARGHAGGAALQGVAEEFGELFGHGAGQFLGVGDGDGTLIVAGHVMTDADGDQLHVRVVFDLVDDLAEVLFEVGAVVHR